MDLVCTIITVALLWFVAIAIMTRKMWREETKYYSVSQRFVKELKREYYASLLGVLATLLIIYFGDFQCLSTIN